MTVQIAYARRPLARRNNIAGLTALSADQFEGYASLFGVADGAGDIVAPGAFAQTLRRRGPSDVRMLYHASPRLGLPDMPETPELYPDIVADAFARLDAFTDLYLKGQFVNTPPSSPADGDAYLTGGAPTGAWSGYAYKIATCRDGAWTMLPPFNGLRAFVATTGAFIVYENGSWTDWTALIGAGEGSIASAATCDIGAAGSLFVAVTGTTSITSFGTAANRMRFLRFAGALTITHHATSLILPGAANIATAAGDTALFVSDAIGNWRCHVYQPVGGVKLASANNVTVGTGWTSVCSIALTPGHWRLSASVFYSGSASNTYGVMNISPNASSGSGVVNGVDYMAYAMDNVQHVGGGAIPALDVWLGTGTTYHLNAGTSTNTDTVSGFLRAERIV